MRLILLAAAAVGLFVGSAWAQDLVGAKEALRIFNEKVQQQADEPGEDQASGTEFGKALATYLQERPNLNAETAAGRWLALYDVWRDSLEQEAEFIYSEAGSAWDRLAKALPGPEAWPALSEQIHAREIPKELKDAVATRGLRILADRLTGNDEALAAELAALDKSITTPAAAAKPAGENSLVVDKLLRRLIGNSDGDSEDAGQFGDVVSAIVELRAAAGLIDPVEQFLVNLSSIHEEWGADIDVPDLVGLAGRDRASELLLQALKTPRARLSFNAKKTETLKLARQLAIDNVAELAIPPWDLCLSTEAGDLFERLLQRSSEDDTDQQAGIFEFRDSYTYYQAASYYFRGLILRGDDETATHLFVEQSADLESYSDLFATWDEIRDSAEERATVFRFLLRLAEGHPNLPVWDQLVAAGAQLGRAAEVRQLVDRILAGGDLDAETGRRLAGIRAGVLLAAGEIDGAIAEFRQTLAAMGEPETEAEINAAGVVAAKMVEIGRLLKRPELRDEGLAVLDELYAAPAGQHPDDYVTSAHYSYVSVFDIYSAELRRREQRGKLEALLVGMAASGGDDSGTFYSDRVSPGELLAELYADAGRFDDVVTLLDEATWWQQDDLSEAIARAAGPMGGMSSSRQKSLALTAAMALANTGKRDLARKMAERLVIAQPGNDAYWALLLDLAGDAFPAVANQVFQRDQFEERPLIWLARYQLDAGQIADAEQTIRRAIAIDPSDGEQGKGDRMRAYAVLAEVLEKKGDDQAAVFRGAVRAIRMAEDADDVIAIGMLSDGVALYNESLTQFADAYCIQSRLALQLASQGDFEAAARHYERAFELMPDSFGRVESHCFGCEGAFAGELASTIAERVFAKFAQERPNDAKVRYLLGYLRSSQGRPAEALTHFQAAVTLDPDYLNAWSAIVGLKSDVAVPRQLADDAAINIYRLAPLREYHSAGFDSAVDLKRVWNMAAEVERRISHVDFGPLYRLQAAADVRAAQQDMFEEDVLFLSTPASGNPLSPNEALSDNTSLAYISQIMEASAQ